MIYISKSCLATKHSEKLFFFAGGDVNDISNNLVILALQHLVNLIELVRSDQLNAGEDIVLGAEVDTFLDTKLIRK